jgi:hypothetical protein
MTGQPDLLEAWIDEGLRRCVARGYHPTIFIGMRRRLGTVPAIEQLVQSGEIQSGFKKLCELDMAHWSIEAAVRRFPHEFTESARECAEFRLKHRDDPALRAR